MPNRDGTGPQGRGKMTGKGMGSCQGEGKQGQNVPFESGKGRRCCKGTKRGLGNRWTSIEGGQEKAINQEE